MKSKDQKVHGNSNCSDFLFQFSAVHLHTRCVPNPLHLCQNIANRFCLLLAWLAVYICHLLPFVFSENMSVIFQRSKLLMPVMQSTCPWSPLKSSLLHVLGTAYTVNYFASYSGFILVTFVAPQCFCLKISCTCTYILIIIFKVALTEAVELLTFFLSLHMHVFNDSLSALLHLIRTLPC